MGLVHVWLTTLNRLVRQVVVPSILATVTLVGSVGFSQAAIVKYDLTFVTQFGPNGDGDFVYEFCSLGSCPALALQTSAGGDNPDLIFDQLFVGGGAEAMLGLMQGDSNSPFFPATNLNSQAGVNGNILSFESDGSGLSGGIYCIRPSTMASGNCESDPSVIGIGTWSAIKQNGHYQLLYVAQLGPELNGSFIFEDCSSGGNNCPALFFQGAFSLTDPDLIFDQLFVGGGAEAMLGLMQGDSSSPFFPATNLNSQAGVNGNILSFESDGPGLSGGIYCIRPSTMASGNCESDPSVIGIGTWSARGVITIDIDIKPGSDPNCFNANGHGVIPVAVLGSDSIDVSNIDQNTLSFGGADVRVRGNKGPLCGSEDVNFDGFYDLVCKFEDNPDYWEPGTDDATLTGTLLDGTSIKGTDAICIVP